MREKEVFSGKSSVGNSVFGRNSLKMSVSFDKNLCENIHMPKKNRSLTEINCGN